jgi:sulfonate dioxygenase
VSVHLFRRLWTGLTRLRRVRASYEPGTVVLWDNRITVHSGTADFSSGERRHAVRLTPQAERPIAATE